MLGYVLFLKKSYYWLLRLHLWYLYSCLPLEIMTCFWMQVIRKRDKKLKMFIVFSLQIINLIYIFLPLLLFFYFQILGRLFQVCRSSRDIQWGRRGCDCIVELWFYNYMCNQCLSPLTLRVRIQLKVRCTWYNIIW
jgi:hypothetical protein